MKTKLLDVKEILPKLMVKLLDISIINTKCWSEFNFLHGSWMYRTTSSHWLYGVFLKPPSKCSHWLPDLLWYASSSGGSASCPILLVLALGSLLWLMGATMVCWSLWWLISPADLLLRCWAHLEPEICPWILW
jgi:hypothetical protein